MSVPSKRSLLAMDLEQMTVAELKEILRSLNLPLVGNKAELIEKIEYMARTMPESVFQYDDIKGLNPLINWSKMTGRLFSPEAAAYGFTRFPAGVLLTGVPGCGKSMVAKAIANEWGMGFRRVHPDELVGSCVGDNESFMRDLVNDLAADAPMVCFIDFRISIQSRIFHDPVYEVVYHSCDGIHASEPFKKRRGFGWSGRRVV